MPKKIEHIDIKSIKDPSVVKKLGYKSLNYLCQDIRDEIIDVTSQYGGHLSSNLGVVELTVSLYRSFDFPKDKLIFDVGHQCYTHKILTGRSLDHLNETGCVSGFEKRAESVYDCYEAGHSGTALSAAEGFAIARDLRGEKYNVIAVVGDSSIVTGLSFEALNNIGSRPNKVIIVLNDNDMSISRPVGGLGNFFRQISTGRAYNRFKEGYRKALMRNGFGRHIYNFSYSIKSHIKALLIPTTMFDNMGLTYIGPVDGHDIHALDHAFQKAKNTTKSAIIHVYTTKGKGYEPAEKDQIGYWHGVTPFDVKTGKPLNMHEGQFSWSHFLGDCAHDILSKNPNVELVVPAMIRGSGLDSCFTDFPKQCLDVGIAEEHAITLAGSLSLNGLRPIVVIYSTFLQRAYDQLSHDVARMNCSLTLLIDRAGFVGPNGDTHQGLYDVAFLKTIPNVTIAQPTSLSEAKSLLTYSVENPRGIFAIRYPHCLTAKLDSVEEIKIDYGMWEPLQKSRNGITVLAVGPLGRSLAEKMMSQGSPAGFTIPLFLNPVLDENLKALLDQKTLFIYDPYGTKEGFAQTVESRLLELGYSGKVIVRSAPTAFVQHGSVDDQLNAAGLSLEQVRSEIALLF